MIGKLLGRTLCLICFANGIMWIFRAVVSPDITLTQYVICFCAAYVFFLGTAAYFDHFKFDK